MTTMATVVGHWAGEDPEAQSPPGPGAFPVCSCGRCTPSGGGPTVLGGPALSSPQARYQWQTTNLQCNTWYGRF